MDQPSLVRVVHPDAWSPQPGGRKTGPPGMIAEVTNDLCRQPRLVETGPHPGINLLSGYDWGDFPQVHVPQRREPQTGIDHDLGNALEVDR
jgi:hypothetical protein